MGNGTRGKRIGMITIIVATEGCSFMIGDGFLATFADSSDSRIDLFRSVSLPRSWATAATGCTHYFVRL